MSPKYFWLAAIFFASASLIAMAWFIEQRSSQNLLFQNRENEVSLPLLGQVPEFSFVDHSNKAFTSASLQGKIWISSFFFTSCEGPCPALMAELSQIDERFSKNDKFGLVSISVDPERDSIAALADYARRFQVSPSWKLLRGPKEEVLNLLNVGFKLGAGNDQILTHSTRIVLIDQTGQIRGYFDGTDKAQVARLNKSIAQLLRRNFSS